METVGGHEQGGVWEFVAAPPQSASGVASMVGYRALEMPGGVHRDMPSSRLTFIVSLDDGVEAAETATGTDVQRCHQKLILKVLDVCGSGYVAQHDSEIESPQNAGRWWSRCCSDCCYACGGSRSLCRPG